GCNVPMYRTSIPTLPAGPFQGPLVVSMRPLKAADAIRAIQVTSRFPSVHGAPVHLGDPAEIGTADIRRPDSGDPVELRAGATPRLPSVQGAPVPLGDPAGLGLADIGRPDYGDPVEIRAGEMPVFWACGVTPQSVVAAVRPAFCITHAPGHMLVTDLLNSRMAVL